MYLGRKKGGNINDSHIQALMNACSINAMKNLPEQYNLRDTRDACSRQTECYREERAPH